ncbi:type I glutamate--ammonia ligase [Pseudomonas fluvialis]|jgi:glutamine synthetase|uniref:Glutamine synthetase n=1 Tax=Pseudomonas fluvialis TaxID=1793966 RepID=A0A2I0CRW7_9PSED|nr:MULTISPECIES: type I glutamate--ammonia ligase [Pseudomonas]PKF71793.1 type I glutamate--ammonia ligase [Pseudomonas pharmacofabricae]GGH94122.1 glutamine synthetase [Pseudomonas fluvialis]
MSKAIQLIKEHDVKWVDLRFTDIKGQQHHITMPARDALDEDFFEHGKMFDGSSIHGWKGIEASDMILLPDDSTAVLDPFTEEPTLILVCDVIEPSTMQGYDRDPRAIAKRAEEFLKSTGIGDTVFVGPEPEFFIFDSVKFKSDMSGSMFKIFSEQAAWNSDADFNGGQGNNGHRIGVKGGYLPTPPSDPDHEIRTAMCNALEEMGQVVEVHHHEVATAGQNEIGVKFNTLVAKADEVQTLKYCVHNVAEAYGKTATFMPKPLYGDNGSGMHVHMSIAKDGKNTFAGDGYAGLSETALYFVGGIIKHGKALNALTNPSTNSYKRLVPGFEAPVMLAYSARNRSASIRIPYVASPKGRRIEARFPDPAANPYLAFAALLMAGIDGIQNKIHPGDAADKNLYDLPPEESKLIPQVCGSLKEALEALEADHDFLLKGGVFSREFLDSFIELKAAEEIKVRTFVHPLEYDLYYSV